MRKTTFGTFFELGGRGAMESLSRTGLDYVIIDTEHGCFSEESTADLILAAERGGLLPYVRIGDIRRPYVLRMLDIGARGLIVPQIHSATEVRELIAHAKFPPLGKRGYCPNRMTGWGADDWSKDVLHYMDECNRRCKLIPQCETRGALEEIEEIAALPGVDGIFVGPFDLSTAMGIPGEFDRPEFKDALRHIAGVCRAAGKPTLIFAGSTAAAREDLAMGYDIIAYSMDASLLIEAGRTAIREILA